MSNVVASGPASRLVHLLFVIQLVSMGAMEMSGPFWPLHLKALSTASWEFGFAGVAVYVGPMLGIVLTSAFWGRVGDRFGHKLMMIRALLGLALTQLALAYAQDVWSILALRFVQGACAGFIAPAQAYGVSIESPARRARLFAYLQVSTNVGSLAGAVMGGLILDHANFRWINIGAAVLCAACAAAVALLLPSVAPAAKAVPATTTVQVDLSSAWRRAPIAGLLAVTGILLVSRMVTQTPFSLYVSSVFGVSNWLVGLCYGLLALGFVVSASLWARYFEHVSLPLALRRISHVAMACAVLTAAAGITRDIGAFFVIHFAWGVLLGATTPVLMALISRSAGSLGQGYVLGVAQSTAQFSSITGIALGGWLTQSFGLQYTYFYVAACYLLAVAAAVLLVRKERMPAPQQQGA
ncbi:MFS transporter [Vogesella indigofera]|uniref:MFS transporter n=1 Tax=Vogesella indigofera TaxID=45465 RepID=A0ABT5I373_VOGIN|nr:MFS transporter [Vogesella indigofera]MDC7690615.1 MFS transporter [Vogesella indigofera]